MNDPTPSRRIHPGALLSLILGLASVGLCLLGLAGLPALLIGVRSLRSINAGDGQEQGATLAKIGIGLGGFTTLVTVVGIFAVLVGRLQEGSRRLQCAENLRQIGVTLRKYADANESFPPATRTPRELPPQKRISWFADILPLLGEGRPIALQFQELADRIDRKRGWQDEGNAGVLNTSVRIFLCPGHPKNTPNRGPGMTDYVGIAGLGLDAASKKREDPGAGIFGNDRGVKREEITGGISYTMMVIETAKENGPWLAGGFPTVRGVDPTEEQYIGVEKDFGGMHHDIVQILWADGSVRPMSKETPAQVFRSCVPLRR